MLEMLPSGLYRMPSIGGESSIQIAETHMRVDEQGIINVQSPLWDKPFTISDGKTFTDPRTDLFLQATVWHQLHHFTTRQLSLVEAYETRPGASRFSRLGGLLDSAKMLQDLGATFEQIFQAVVSDLGQPAGSHLRGDFLIGDYQDQDSHDQVLTNYLVRSGFIDLLHQIGLIDERHCIAGSNTGWYALADPRLPRRHDIVECPRPDGNGDRIPFTFHEGTVVHDPSEIREAMLCMQRVETDDGERVAMTKIEAARLLFRLAIRHQSEHWGDPIHRLVEELVMIPERAVFVTRELNVRELQQYHPVDYARRDEGSWYELMAGIVQTHSGLSALADMTQALAEHQRQIALNYIGNETYKGPVLPDNLQLESPTRKPTYKLWLEEDGLLVVLPKPKYRGSIDSLVATKTGLKRVSALDPDLLEFEANRRAWAQVQWVARLAIPQSLSRDLSTLVSDLNRYWFDYSRQIANIHPLNRPVMPDQVLVDQLGKARTRVVGESRHTGLDK